MKNLYVTSFSLFFVILCACEHEESYGEKTFSHPNHQSQGRNGSTGNVGNIGNVRGTGNTKKASNYTKKSLNDIELELTSLERSLTRNFGYRFVYKAGFFQKITPPRQIANTPSVSFKFYKDSLEYATYALFLEKNRSRYLHKGTTHYNELLKRTSAMINLIHNPTHAYILYQLNALEQNEYDFRIVALIDSLNIKVSLYSPRRSSARNVHSAKSRSVFAANLCSMLNALNRFNFNGVTKRHCRDYDKVNFIRRVKSNLSLQENTIRINAKILKKSLSLVQSTMNDSSIFLDASSSTGIHAQRRSFFETQSFKINSQHSKHEVQAALNNNLYENLYFLIEVLEAKQRVSGLSNKESRNHQAALKAIASVTYSNDSFSVGLSPFYSDVFTKTSITTVNNTATHQSARATNSNILVEQTETVSIDSPVVSRGTLDETLNTNREALQTSPLVTKDIETVQIRTQEAIEPQHQNQIEVQTTVETEVNDESVLAEGNSSNAPLNTFEETPISLPEDVEEFFKD